MEDFGWDAVMDELMVMAATAPKEDLDEDQALLDAAIAVNEGKGQWADDPAAIDAMKAKVPQSVGECLDLISRANNKPNLVRQNRTVS